MKFSNVVLGTRAEKSIEMEIRGVVFPFALRPLTGTEEGDALARATEYATEKKAAKVESGNPLFDLALMLESLAIACVDVDSPKDARAPCFSSAREIADALDGEQIAWLYARYEIWQAECSPSKRARTGADLVKLLVDVVEADDDLPFSQARPGDVWNLLRFTGRLVLSSPELRSQATSLYDSTTTH
jgi:hypothetical protein